MNNLQCFLHSDDYCGMPNLAKVYLREPRLGKAVSGLGAESPLIRDNFRVTFSLYE